MNKSELVNNIAANTELSKAEAGRALDATICAVKNALKSQTAVTLSGFGTFYVGERSARMGRNPQTGDKIEIAAARIPKFRAGKDLKDALK